MLQTMLLPGHTPGSTVFLDRKAELMFSGDGIGAGVFWLQLPHSLSLEEFQRSLQKLRERVGNWKSLHILPGHKDQSSGPLEQQYLEDVWKAAEGIYSGALRGETQTMELPEGERVSFAIVGQGGVYAFFYNPSRIKA